MESSRLLRGGGVPILGVMSRPELRFCPTVLLTLLVVQAVYAADAAVLPVSEPRPVERVDSRSLGRAIATAVRDLVGQRVGAAIESAGVVRVGPRACVHVACEAAVPLPVEPLREALIDLPPPAC